MGGSEMNMDDYKQKAEELRQQASQLESEMLTYQAFAHCVKHGHDWDMITIQDGDLDAHCMRCSIRLSAKKIELVFDERNTEGFGSLAGKTHEEVAETLLASLTGASPSISETSETDEKPTFPLESESDSSGTYRVDVSSIIGKQEE
jgi:hypothetical protein